MADVAAPVAVAVVVAVWAVTRLRRGRRARRRWHLHLTIDRDDEAAD